MPDDDAAPGIDAGANPLVALDDAALRSTRAAQLERALVGRGVLTDTRGEWLRLGPAPCLSDAQLEEAVGVLGSVTCGSLAPR
jgi:hypothetical protein